MICIYHSRDLDGWMSAAIVKLKYPDIKLIGWDYGDSIPEISKGERIIMVDISFPLTQMDLLAGNVHSIQKDFIWIDHHISAIKECSIKIKDNFIAGYGGIRDIKFAACELTWKYFFPNKPIPELVRLLGRYDCFGHKGTDEEQKVIEFQYGARQSIPDVENAYAVLVTVINQAELKMDTNVCDDILIQGKVIYKYLCTEAQQIYSRKFDINFDTRGSENRDWTSSDRKYKFACVNQERFNPVNFGIDYHKEFCYM